MHQLSLCHSGAKCASSYLTFRVKMLQPSLCLWDAKCTNPYSVCRVQNALMFSPTLNCKMQQPPPCLCTNKTTHCWIPSPLHMHTGCRLSVDPLFITWFRFLFGGGGAGGGGGLSLYRRPFPGWGLGENGAQQRVYAQQPHKVKFLVQYIRFLLYFQSSPLHLSLTDKSLFIPSNLFMMNFTTGFDILWPLS